MEIDSTTETVYGKDKLVKLRNERLIEQQKMFPEMTDLKELYLNDEGLRGVSPIDPELRRVDLLAIIKEFENNPYFLYHFIIDTDNCTGVYSIDEFNYNTIQRQTFKDISNGILLTPYELCTDKGLISLYRDMLSDELLRTSKMLDIYNQT